jgi:hypothetical protein
MTPLALISAGQQAKEETGHGEKNLASASQSLDYQALGHCLL